MKSKLSCAGLDFFSHLGRIFSYPGYLVVSKSLLESELSKLQGFTPTPPRIYANEAWSRRKQHGARGQTGSCRLTQCETRTAKAKILPLSRSSWDEAVTDRESYLEGALSP